MFVRDVLDLWYSGYFVFIAVFIALKTSRTRTGSTKKKWKKELVNSLVNNNVAEIEELNEQAGIVDNPEDAADLIKKYEEIFRTKRQGIISVA